MLESVSHLSYQTRSKIVLTTSIFAGRAAVGVGEARQDEESPQRPRYHGHAASDYDGREQSYHMLDTLSHDGRSIRRTTLATVPLPCTEARGSLRLYTPPLHRHACVFMRVCVCGCVITLLLKYTDGAGTLPSWGPTFYPYFFLTYNHFSIPKVVAFTSSCLRLSTTLC